MTKKDFEIQTFRSGGKGGQHQNTTDSGVRIIHKDSGATGECRNHRSQHQNKKEAFERLVNSDKFQTWHKLECARRMSNILSAEEQVDNDLLDKNLKIEVKQDGKWVEVKKDALTDDS